MAEQTSKLQVSELDYSSIKTNLVTFLKSQSEFTNFDFAGSGLDVIMDLLSYNTYYNSFYLNMLANEMFLDTAELRNSVVQKAKQIGYTPRSVQGTKAVVQLTITPNDAATTMIVEKDKTLSFYGKPECSFASILLKMASQNQISAWVQNDSYHSISDPDRWKKANEYLSPKKIILVDRDGVINKKASQGEYISKWEDFEWIEETRHAMKMLAKAGFKFIVISNQAGISRGMVDTDNLEQIHNNMKYELMHDGIEILDIYICPHHWNEECFCRKPKPGMFLKASKDHLFRLDKTLYIGDDPRDVEAALNAGTDYILISEEKTNIDNHDNFVDIKSYFSLIEALDTIKAKLL